MLMKYSWRISSYCLLQSLAKCKCHFLSLSLDAASSEMGFGGDILLRFSLMLLRCTISWSFLLISRPLFFWQEHRCFTIILATFPLPDSKWDAIFSWQSFFFFCTKDIQVQCTLSGTMCLLCHYLWMADGLEVILFQDLDAPITANDMAVASSKLAVRSILLSFVWFLKVCLRFAKATWISSP